MEYNIFLILLAVLSLYEVFLSKNQKEIKFMLLLIASFVYWIFFGFRGFVSWDWFNYYRAFLGENLSFEFGYTLFMEFGRCIFKTYFNFIAFSTLIDIFILSYFFYKYSPYPVMSLCMFLTFNGMHIQFDLLRHMRTLLLFLLSLSFLEKRNLRSYLFFNIIGSFFHRIGLFYLPLYFILNRNIIKYKKIIFFLLTIVIGLAMLKINLVRIAIMHFSDIQFYGIGQKITRYLVSIHGNSQISTIGHIERLLTLFLFWNYLPKISKYRHGKIFVNMYILYLFTYYSFYSFRILSDRLAGFTFIVSYWIIYPTIIFLSKGYKKYFIFICLFIFMFLKINLIYTLKNVELYNYKNILFQEENLLIRKEIYIKTKKEEKERVEKYIQRNKN